LFVENRRKFEWLLNLMTTMMRNLEGLRYLFVTSLVVLVDSSNSCSVLRLADVHFICLLSVFEETC